MVGFGPIHELGFDREDDVIQLRKVAVMETEPARELPDPLRRIQLRTVRWQEVQRKTLGPFLLPVPVQPRMVVSGVVGNHHHPSSRAGADRPQVFQELPAGRGVELAGLTPEEESAVAQADRSEVAHALPGGMMEQNGVFGFARDPHPATRAVLLEVNFVHGPEVNRGVGA